MSCVSVKATAYFQKAISIIERVSIFRLHCKREDQELSHRKVVTWLV